jgi:phthalate 4,5-dioxygenase oxygenase subunit
MQDMAMWASMGPITDRTRDRLGASDVAIVEFRRIMLDAVRQFAAGEPAIGTQGARPLAALRAFEGVIPKADDWRTLGRVAGTRAGETV